MKTILQVLAACAVLCSSVAHAQTYTYYGFTGSGPDAYTTATSNDGITWTNAGGSWPSCITSNGSQSCQVNAPSPIYTGGQTYLLIASANDEQLAYVTQQVGLINPATKVVSTIATIDWTAAIPGVYVCFAGNWFVEDDGSLHITTPCSTGGGFSNFQIYESHPLNAAMTSWSAPVNMDENVNGYDPQVFKVGSLYTMFVTRYTPSGMSSQFGSAFCILTSSTLLGPYTSQGCSDTDTLSEAIGIPREGNNALHTTSATSWYFYDENVGSRQMSYSGCSTLLFTQCTYPAVTAWTMDQQYRHGTVIRTPLSPAGLLGGG